MIRIDYYEKPDGDIETKWVREDGVSHSFIGRLQLTVGEWQVIKESLEFADMLILLSEINQDGKKTQL